MGSFFYWLYAVGYKLLHRKPKGEPKGNEDKEFRHIHLEYPVFWLKTVEGCQWNIPEIGLRRMPVLGALTVRLNFAT